MCAIAGMICLQPDCGDDHLDVVRAISDLQVHRGPDDQGVKALGGATLASNRLSIIDLSRAGHMPMSDETGRYWIVYNGETYNFRQLREELSARGHAFSSRTDTEAVLHACLEWGDDAFGKFVGMFAFAVVDRETRTTTLVRDRFGKKPLYYTHRDGHLLFASEVKALLRVSASPTLNYQRLIEWSLYRNVDFGSPETLFENIFSLQPGHSLKIVNGQVGEPRCYYSPESQVDPELYERFRRQPPAAVTAEIESLIVNAVRERLVSDVPLGTLCSGGIDSSLVTALCARSRPGVNAFHVSVAGYDQLDESRYARQVADSVGIPLLTYSIGADAFRRNLPRAIYHSDFPLTHPNSVAFLLISEFARQHGVIILMSGEAADELFGGYMQRYRHFRQFRRAQRMLSTFPKKVRKALAFAGYASEGIPVTSFSEYDGLLAHTTAFLDKFAREDLRIRCEEAYAAVADPAERAVLGAMLVRHHQFPHAPASSSRPHEHGGLRRVPHAVPGPPAGTRRRQSAADLPAAREHRQVDPERSRRAVPAARGGVSAEARVPAAGEGLSGAARAPGVLRERVRPRRTPHAPARVPGRHRELAPERPRVLQPARTGNLGTPVRASPVGRYRD